MALSKFEEKMIFLFAVLCSMNALMIGGNSISNYVIILLIIYHFFKYWHCLSFNIRNPASVFCWLFLISIFLSIIFSFNILPSTWVSNSFSCAVKYILIFGYLFLLQPSNKLRYIRKVFFNGFYIGAIIQMIWGYLQFVCYYVFHIALNQVIFGNFLKLSQFTQTKVIGGNVIRMTGIGWEPADFALVIVIGYILSCTKENNTILTLLFVIALTLSTSRSGYIAMLAVLCFQLIQSRKKLNMNKYTLLRLLFILLLLISTFVIFHNEIINRLQIIQAQFNDAFTNTAVDSSASIHSSYYRDLISIIRENPVINWFVGAGYFSVGYYYSLFNPLLSSRFSMIGWNPESDFVTLILGNGILGTLLYYISSIRSIWLHRRDYLSLIVISIIVCGFAYLTVRGTWPLILICFSLIDCRNINLNYSKQFK